jgi:hypothetical protein
MAKPNKAKELQNSIAEMERLKAALNDAREAEFLASKQHHQASGKRAAAEFALQGACSKVRQLAGIPYGYN